MDNPMEILSELMKNKDAVDTVKNMFNKPEESNHPAEIPDLAFLAKMLSENKQSAQVLGKLKGVYDVYNDENDPSLRLLRDLAPFLSGKKAENIDRIAKIAKMSKALNKISRG